MAERIAADATLARAPGALARRSLDGVLVLGPDSETPMLMTPPGDLVWQLLVEPITVDDLIADLAARFDSDERVVRADVETLLVTLLDASTIRIVTPSCD